MCFESISILRNFEIEFYEHLPPDSISKFSMCFRNNHASIYTQGSGKSRLFEGISRYWLSFRTTLTRVLTLSAAEEIPQVLI